tara:strand:- start:8020 stop:8445 length:426 start_codon:yes stop_codon:yes gene_type:complete
MNNHKLTIEKIKVGQSAEFLKLISEEDIKQFARLTGDNNPIHLDDEYAKKTMFKKRIAHGLLTASFISTVIATKLPGQGSIYLDQSLKFLAPVYIGNQIRIFVKVTKKNIEKRIVTLSTEVYVSEKKIITGEARILLDDKS